MERLGQWGLSLTTKELREIARDAQSRKLERQLTPAQYKLLEPTFRHVMAVYHIANKIAECSVLMKLIGKEDGIEQIIDVPIDRIADYFDNYEFQELIDGWPVDEKLKKIDAQNL